MNSYSDGERRAFKRVSHLEPVQIKLRSESVYQGCVAKDISEGGIRLQVNDFVPLRSEVFLQVQFGPQRVVECGGVVRWVSQLPYSEAYQLGLFFPENGSSALVRRSVRELLQTV